MPHFQGCGFINKTVVLDGNEFIKCKFENSLIVITRGNFTLDNCKFNGCKFEFGGEAANIRGLVLSILKQPHLAAPQPQTSEKQNEAAKHE